MIYTGGFELCSPALFRSFPNRLAFYIEFLNEVIKLSVRRNANRERIRTEPKSFHMLRFVNFVKNRAHKIGKNSIT